MYYCYDHNINWAMITTSTGTMVSLFNLRLNFNNSMQKYIFFTIFILFFISVRAMADGMSFRLTTEGAIGNGDFTPYYLTANRHGILSTDNGTGYVRAAASWERSLGAARLQAVADVQLQADDYSRFYLQQLAAIASWRYAKVGLGAWEIAPLLRDASLSSGSTVWSGNARPIPQVMVSTPGFIDIPGTRQWLQVYFDIRYGRYTDDEYLKTRHREHMDYWAERGIDKHEMPNAYVTSGIWHHHKQIHFRTNPEKTWSGDVGLEHAVQFGGKSVNNANTGYVTTNNSVGLKDFFKVLMPTSGDGSDNVGDQNFAYGNHIGNLQATLTYRHEKWHASAYLENLYEDGSGMAKRNGWDGLWGVEWHAARPAWVDGVVVEYLQTTEQSGPIHWAPSDFDIAVRQQMPDEARGADDYYNNYYFCGYAHHGQAIGSPMLPSPAYNADRYLRFANTRVRAWHIGISGRTATYDVRSTMPEDRHVSYRILLSYRNAYGTPFISSNNVLHSLNGLAECTYYINSVWSIGASAAFDHGSLLGNQTAADLRATYTFKADKGK